MLPFKTLLPECSKLLNEYRPRPKTLTLYATYRSGTKSLYIAGANGVLGLYVIESGTCDIDVPILALLRKPHIPPLHAGPPMLSDTEVSGLFDDALRRYTTAFGGKQHFLQWLDTLTAKKRGGCESQPELSCPQTYKLLLAPQKTQLENYRLK